MNAPGQVRTQSFRPVNTLDVPDDEANENTGQPVSDNTGTSTTERIYTSYANSQLRYTRGNTTQPVMNDKCVVEFKKVEISCLLAYLQCCDQHPLCFGHSCLGHCNSLQKRHFVSTTNDGGISPISSVGLTRSFAVETMFLISSLPGNPTADDLRASLNPLMNHLDGAKMNSVVKFFLLLAKEESNWNQDAHMNEFKRYMVEIAQGYYKCLFEHDNIINMSVIPISVSPEYYKRITNSSWWQEIFNEVGKSVTVTLNSDNSVNTNIDVRKVNATTSVIYHIPLAKFCIIDILMILSYNFDLRFGNVGYMSNCMFYDGVLVIGTGTGLVNTIQTSKSRVNFCNYTPDVRHILESKMSVPQHNLDYIVLPVEPRKYTEDLTHNIIISSRKNVNYEVSLEKITEKRSNGPLQTFM